MQPETLSNTVQRAIDTAQEYSDTVPELVAATTQVDVASFVESMDISDAETLDMETDSSLQDNGVPEYELDPPPQDHEVPEGELPTEEQFETGMVEDEVFDDWGSQSEDAFVQDAGLEAGAARDLMVPVEPPGAIGGDHESQADSQVPAIRDAIRAVEGGQDDRGGGIPSEDHSQPQPRPTTAQAAAERASGYEHPGKRARAVALQRLRGNDPEIATEDEAAGEVPQFKTSAYHALNMDIDGELPPSATPRISEGGVGGVVANLGGAENDFRSKFVEFSESVTGLAIETSSRLEELIREIEEARR